MRKAILLVAGLALLLAGCGTTPAPTPAPTGQNLDLVYILGDMPYFGVTNGNLDGVDGDLLKKVEQDQGYKFTTHSAEFSAFLEGIQSHRYDIGVGGVAWTKARAATGLFTDPVYYSPVVVMCKQGLHPSTPSALKGHSVGAVTASIQDKGIRAVSGVDAHSYPGTQNMLEDLIAGRLDCISLDTLIVADIHKTRPDLKSFDITALQSPSDADIQANPDLANFQPYMVAWYLAPSDKDVVAKLNKEIDSWYKSGFLAKTLSKWGVTDPASMLRPIPSFSTQRQGVDRPSNWSAPSV